MLIDFANFHDHFQRVTQVTLSPARDSPNGSPTTALPTASYSDPPTEDQAYTNPPPLSEASSSAPDSPRPPPFSSLYFPPETELDRLKATVTEASAGSITATAPAPSFAETLEEDRAERAAAETKAALPRDNKGESSGKGVDDGEPPPPYSEGSSPLESFTYVMAAAGGAASIITQVQQTGGPPINTLGDELLTLPEFVLLSLFPNGLLPDGHMNSLHDGDVYPVDYDPASLQYMLEFFRTVAQSIPSASPSPTTSPDPDTIPIEPMQGSARDMLQDRAGIIVLREDLDFYVIPPKQEIEQPEMIEVKRAASKSLLKQNGIFSGLRRSEEAGTTEQHLIEMLTAGGFDHDDKWGHRAGEPNKAVICSLALARLRTDIKGDAINNNAVGMAQKLLLFWRKPARRCWWEGVELNDVEGVEGALKVTHMQAQQVIANSGHDDMIHDAVLDYYGRRLATCSHEGAVWCVSWAHPKFGTILASSSYDSQVHIYRETPSQSPSHPSTWTLVFPYRHHTASVNMVSWSPPESGCLLACASSDGQISILEFRDNEWLSCVIHGHGLGVNAVSWSPASTPGALGKRDPGVPPPSAAGGGGGGLRRFATGGSDNQVKIWEYEPGQQTYVNLATLPNGHADWVRDVAWSPSLLGKTYIASASQDKTVRIWTSTDPAGREWELRKELKFEAVTWRVSWSGSGNVLAVSGGDNKVALFKENLKGEWECVREITE
ncbi:MAG: hypothetical protein Q9227_008579 [Pyrenula ochraceoflavens]